MLKKDLAKKRRLQRQGTDDEVKKMLFSFLERLQCDEQDEAGAFGDYVASCLHQFTKYQRAITCIKIEKLLKAEFSDEILVQSTT